MKKIFTIILFTSLISNSLSSQDIPKKWRLNGYISGMQTALITDADQPWIKEDLLHNRLNFSWFPNNKFTFNLQMRNRIIWGDRDVQLPGYYHLLDKDGGFFDLSYNLGDNKYYAINSFIDRANIEYIKGNLNITIGRQRINWGKTIAWNANDIFNTYSFFEVDYPERPGADALRLQYYTSYTSALELAVKLDSAKNMTAAALYRFNIKNYDIQFIGGLYEDREWAIGTGWEGNIKDFSFKGEGTYLIPKDSKDSLSNMLLFSTSLGYSFSNSLNIYGEILFKFDSTDNNYTDFSLFFNTNNTVRSLAFSDISYLGQISYPFNPLFTGSLSIMYFPDLNGYLINPSCEISLKDNLYLSAIYQYFSFDLDFIERQHLNIGYLRLKWNF